MVTVVRLGAIVVATVGLLVTTSAQQPVIGGTFRTAVEYPAGSYPWAVTAGEFNGDAVPDLAVANLSLGVSVLLGVGDGSLHPPVNYRTAGYADSVLSGDFDGDGKGDLVVGMQYGEAAVVLMNRGDGTFAAPLTSPGLAAAAVGDFNGDGRDDLAAGGVAFGGVGIFLGNGDGTFQPAAHYPTGRPYPNAIVVGEFTGDTEPDLVTNGNYGLNLLEGHGDGTFGPATRVSNTDASRLVRGDFDGDGRADLAALGLAAGRSVIHVVLGRGDGAFDAAAVYSRDIHTVALAPGDLNADGRDDLAVVSYLGNEKSGMLSGGDVAVMLAAEGGDLLPEVHYGAGQWPRAIAVADLDSDAKADLAVANPTSFRASVLLNGPVAITRTMHVGDLGAHVKRGLDGSTWQVLVRVRAETENHTAAPAGTIVSGVWDDGSAGSCATELPGRCTIGKSDIPIGAGTATFRVTGLANPAYPEFGYDPAANHDPTGDSDGTSITASRP